MMSQSDKEKPTMREAGTTQLAVRCLGMATALLLLGAGCIDLGYLIPAAIGQLDLLRNSIPISQAIDDGGLSEEQAAKLELILDAREYARDVIGLNVGNDYTTFYESGGEPVAYNVSACRKDAFEPKLWQFPIVGTVPYLGFFDYDAALARYDQLTAEGLDVFMYEVDAYSGLGYFSNPVLSPMLDRSEISLADTVFHELLHSTIWRANDTSFNESLATFVGRTAAVRYITDRYPDRPELVREAMDLFEDGDRYSDAMLALFNDLDSFYSSGLSSEARIAGREAIYQAGRDRFAAEVQPLMNRPERYDWVRSIPTNNAWMMGIRRYNLDLDVFERVFAATGEDWPASMELFRASARTADPYAFLEARLESPGDLPSAKSSETNPDAQLQVDPERRPLRGPCPARLSTTILCPEESPSPATPAP
jgi:predicted aminopeptidase